MTKGEGAILEGQGVNKLDVQAINLCFCSNKLFLVLSQLQFLFVGKIVHLLDFFLWLLMILRISHKMLSKLIQFTLCHTKLSGKDAPLLYNHHHLLRYFLEFLAQNRQLASPIQFLLSDEKLRVKANDLRIIALLSLRELGYRRFSFQLNKFPH